MIPLSLAPYLLLFQALSVSADPIHINLARRGSGPRNATYYAGIAEGIRAKYGFTTAAEIARRGVHGVVKRANTAGIPIINQVRSFLIVVPGVGLIFM